MRLITRFELAGRSTHELRGLRRLAFNALAAAPRGSAARCNALASLETIDAELRERSLRP